MFTFASHEIEDNWNLIRPFLERIVGADWTVDGVKEELKAARSQLWGFADEYQILGIWITRVENFHDMRYGLVWIAAGSEMESGIELFKAHTEQWFKDLGCQFIEIVGRKGWARALPDYSETARIFRKDL